MRLTCAALVQIVALQARRARGTLSCTAPKLPVGWRSRVPFRQPLGGSAARSCLDRPPQRRQLLLQQRLDEPAHARADTGLDRVKSGLSRSTPSAAAPLRRTAQHSGHGRRRRLRRVARARSLHRGRHVVTQARFELRDPTGVTRHGLARHVGKASQQAVGLPARSYAAGDIATALHDPVNPARADKSGPAGTGLDLAIKATTAGMHPSGWSPRATRGRHHGGRHAG